MFAFSGVAFFFLVQVLQNKAIRIIGKYVKEVYETSAGYKSLNLLNVGESRGFQASIFVYQCMNDLVPAIFKKFYCLNSQVHDYETRNGDDVAIESTGTVRSAFMVRYMGPLI